MNNVTLRSLSKKENLAPFFVSSSPFSEIFRLPVFILLLPSTEFESHVTMGSEGRINKDNCESCPEGAHVRYSYPSETELIAFNLAQNPEICIYSPQIATQIARSLACCTIPEAHREHKLHQTSSWAMTM